MPHRTYTTLDIYHTACVHPSSSMLQDMHILRHTGGYAAGFLLLSFVSIALTSRFMQSGLQTRLIEDCRRMQWSLTLGEATTFLAFLR